jgi:antitoxin HigA-1
MSSPIWLKKSTLLIIIKKRWLFFMKNPPHPGDLIKSEIIKALGLSISEAASILKVRRATLSNLLNCKSALSPEMALRIEKAFGPDMDHLLRMQLAYDIAQIRRHAGRIMVKRYVAA